MKINYLLSKSSVTCTQQVSGDKHLKLGTIVKVTYLALGVYWVSGSGKKETLGVLGEYKAVAIRPCDFIKLPALSKGEPR